MLKYLFTAFFTDDTSFEQNADDVSLLDPKRSSFQELLEQIKSGKTLQSFILSGYIDGKVHNYGVDLIDGHFEIDGVAFWAKPKDLPAQPDAFKLVFYRLHTHESELKGTVLADGSVSQTMTEMTHSMRFVIGWECNIRGRNYNQTIGVD